MAMYAPSKTFNLAGLVGSLLRFTSEYIRKLGCCYSGYTLSHKLQSTVIPKIVL